jgi:hypothetical protein
VPASRIEVLVDLQARPETARLLGQVDEDGGRVEDAHFLAVWLVDVDDGWHLTVRIDGAERWEMLLALAGVNGHGLLGEPRFLQW